MVNHWAPAGSGGGGIRLQLNVGIVSVGPDVVWATMVETPYDQSQATMFPGADDVLPLYLRKSDAELAWDRKD